MSNSPGFLFVTCQVGAEASVKGEMARMWPAFRFAYSRAGFLTFKLPAGGEPPDDLDLESVFARAYGFSIGKAEGTTPEERARSVWTLLGDKAVQRLHVWPRDTQEPGARDYEPGITDAALAAARLILAANPSERDLVLLSKTPEEPTKDSISGEIGRLAADVVLVEPEEWWVGCHRVRSIESSWAGGYFPESLPADAVSRVYLKMREALAWSGFEIRRGQRVAEIGCAPGGASQVLLDLGANVVGIDPAEMAPAVLGHPRFRHIRSRSKEVRRREFLGVDWLTCDINLPPKYTLDTVEAVVTHPGVRPKGLLLTLKLIEWSLAAEIPQYLDRVRGWGYAHARARQLHHNRREVCVAARR